MAPCLAFIQRKQLKIRISFSPKCKKQGRDALLLPLMNGEIPGAAWLHKGERLQGGCTSFLFFLLLLLSLPWPSLAGQSVFDLSPQLGSMMGG